MGSRREMLQFGIHGCAGSWQAGSYWSSGKADLQEASLEAEQTLGPRRAADLQEASLKAEQTLLMCRKSSRGGRRPAPPKGEFLAELKLIGSVREVEVGTGCLEC